MKKKMRIFNWILAASTFLFCMIPTVAMSAANTYTITFRAGNVGTFDTSRISTIDGEVEATENYIKFTVEKGSNLTKYFADNAALMSTLEYCVVTEENYFLQEESEWGPSVTEACYHNEEYVLDYGMLVDGVEYTVSYLDAATGEQIAAPTIAYRNVGDTILVSPLAITGYTTTDTAVNLVLQKGATNQVSFSYTAAAGPSVVNTIINYIPGTTTVTPAVTPAVTPVTPVTPDADIQDDDVPLTPDDNAGVTDGDVDIQDDDVPLAPGEDGSDDVTTIDDEEVPLDSGQETMGNSRLVPILIGIFAVATIIVIVILGYGKKKQNQMK